MKYEWIMPVFIGAASLFSSCTGNYGGGSAEPVAKYPSMGKDTMFESHVSETKYLPFKDAVVEFRSASGVCRIGGNVISYDISPKFPAGSGMGGFIYVCDEEGKDISKVVDDATYELYMDKIISMLNSGNTK